MSRFGVVMKGDSRKYVGPPAKFKSKYLNYDEADGLALFKADSDVQLSGAGHNVGGMGYLCHLTERHDPEYGENTTQGQNPRTSDGTYPLMLTDFTYDNLGIPVNPRTAALSFPQEIDKELGAESRADELTTLHAGANLAEEVGKFTVSTLRNIAETLHMVTTGSSQRSIQLFIFTILVTITGRERVFLRLSTRQQ